MKTSITSKIVSTTYKYGARVEESMEKYENINIMMWPADKLVAKRIVKVRGRINCENTSTRGKNNINPVGAP